jgi:hypothetical protein
MRSIGLMVGVLALALAALPALATDESGEAAMGAAGAAASADEPAPAASSSEEKAGAAGEAATQAEAAAGEAATAGEAEPAASAGALRGSVGRATFTTQVVDREPQDEITSLPNSVSEIAFFTEFDDLTGHTLTHVWEYDGNEVARVPFQVNGPRWRVHSTKQLQPGWLGTWTVSVVDEDGKVLGSESFDYVAAEPAAATTAASAGKPAPEEPQAAPATAASAGESAPAGSEAAPAPPAALQE